MRMACFRPIRLPLLSHSCSAESESGNEGHAYCDNERFEAFIYTSGLSSGLEWDWATTHLWGVLLILATKLLIFSSLVSGLGVSDVFIHCSILFFFFLTWLTEGVR